MLAARDISKGETFATDALEEKDVDASKIPVGAVTSRSLVAGRVAGHNIAKGDVIYDRDIMNIEELKDKSANEQK